MRKNDALEASRNPNTMCFLLSWNSKRVDSLLASNAVAVAYKLWEGKLGCGALPEGVDDPADALAMVNLLGNCSLLEKTFNISKSDKTLRSFMEQVHEFKEGKVALADWAQRLGIDENMLDASAATTDQIVNAMQTREQIDSSGIAGIREGHEDSGRLGTVT